MACRLLYKTGLLLPLSLLVFSSTAYSRPTTADSLTYMIDEVSEPPYAFRENGTWKGISIDIAKLMWRELGIPPQPIQAYPWARAFQYLQTYENHVILGITKTPERESLFKWVGPYVSLRFGLFGPRSSGCPKTLTDLKNQSVGVMREDVIKDLLISRNFQGTMVYVRRIDQSIQMLSTGRISYIGSTELGFYNAIQRADLNPGEFCLAVLLQESGGYMGFSADVSDELIDQFREILETHQEEVRTIIDRYIR